MAKTFIFKQSESESTLFHRILMAVFPDIQIPKNTNYVSDSVVVYNGVKFVLLTVQFGFGTGRRYYFEGINIFVTTRKRAYRRVMAKKIDLAPDPSFSFDLGSLQEKYDELFPLIAAYEEGRKQVAQMEHTKEKRVKEVAKRLGVLSSELTETYDNKYRITITETPEVLEAVMKTIKKMTK